MAIEDPATIFRGVDLYIGDGASLTRPIIRRRGRKRFGHNDDPRAARVVQVLRPAR